jgi:protein NrfD
MAPPPSDTFFTASPHWGWLIVLYFFFGGLAGGSYFIAALLDLFGTPADRKLARLGYLASFVCLLPCPPLLVIDLSRPERFWHMLIMSERAAPMFKLWSPMSFGSWALLVFGPFVFISFLGALAEGDGALAGSLRRLRGLREKAALRVALAAGGGISGLVVAGYTGVLLSVTNRPIWADTTLLGALFLISAAASSASLLLLLGSRPGAADPTSLAWLSKFEVRTALLELIAALVVSLGPVARVWVSAWGAALFIFVVLLGIALPILLHARPKLAGARAAALGPLLVLIGGLSLRAVVILSSEAI